ncbi:hypothetical protein GCM10027562_05040 [Arthrobacter pigmenti]
MREVALILHALHQDRADHTAPTNQANGRGGRVYANRSHNPIVLGCGGRWLIDMTMTAVIKEGVSPDPRSASEPFPDAGAQ